MADRDTQLTPMRLVVAFGIVTIIVLVVAASTSTTAFGVYNAGWDGTSDVRALADEAGATTEIAREMTAYTEGSPNQTVSVLLAPDDAYGPRDRERIRRFVDNGGTVLIAADGESHANTLLQSLDAEARIDGRPLRDERYYYRSPAMPVARNVGNHSLVTGVTALTLNHGTAVTPHNATVLVRTSGYAYLDTNRNAELDATEAVGTYPVATTEQLGQGRLIVVSDPSVFINAMLDRSGNRAFAQAIFAAHDRVLFDHSHTADLPPLAVVLLTLRDAVLLQFLCGLLGTLAIGLAMRVDGPTAIREAISGSASPPATVEVSDSELAAYLRDRHPDWDDDRIQRVVAARRDERQD